MLNFWPFNFSFFQKKKKAVTPPIMSRVEEPREIRVKSHIDTYRDKHENEVRMSSERASKHATNYYNNPTSYEDNLLSAVIIESSINSSNETMFVQEEYRNDDNMNDKFIDQDSISNEECEEFVTYEPACEEVVYEEPSYSNDSSNDYSSCSNDF